MSFPRAVTVSEFFPRWKATPAILELTERSLCRYSVEQVKAATGRQRLERGTANDPDILGIVRQIQGDRKPAESTHHVAGEIPIRPENATDRRFSLLCRSWEGDIAAEMKKPGFDFLAYRDRAHKLAARDLTEFEITEHASVQAFLRRCGREVGIKCGTDTDAAGVRA